MAPIRILIADDHRLVLAGIKTLLQSDRAMQVIAEAVDGGSAVQLAAQLNPDIVVLDLSMPGLGGIQAVKALRVRCPRCHILILSVHEERAYLRQLLEMGISGYVVKRSAPEELITAIRAVAAGGIYLDPAIAGIIIGHGSRPGSARNTKSLPELSSREEEVVRLAAAGYTNKEVSLRLRIGVKTIETYKARAMEKLGLNTRADLVRYATIKGWLGGP